MSIRQVLNRFLPHTGSIAENQAERDAPAQDYKVCVRTFAHRYEADIAKAVLDGQDIPSYVSSQDCGGTRLLLVEVTGGACLWVTRRHLEKARQLLELEERSAETTSQEAQRDV